MRNGRGVAFAFLGGTCGSLGGSCGGPELPWRDADYALEVAGELALVGEAGVRGDVRQGQVRPGLQQLPGTLDAAGDDVLVGRQPGGLLELPGEVVGAEPGDRQHLFPLERPRVGLPAGTSEIAPAGGGTCRFTPSYRRSISTGGPAKRMSMWWGRGAGGGPRRAPPGREAPPGPPPPTPRSP